MAVLMHTALYRHSIDAEYHLNRDFLYDPGVGGSSFEQRPASTPVTRSVAAPSSQPPSTVPASQSPQAQDTLADSSDSASQRPPASSATDEVAQSDSGLPSSASSSTAAVQAGASSSSVGSALSQTSSATHRSGTATNLPVATSTLEGGRTVFVTPSPVGEAPGSNAAPAEKSEQAGGSNGVIIGVSAAAGVLSLLVIAALALCWRRRRRANTVQQMTQMPPFGDQASPWTSRNLLPVLVTRNRWGDSHGNDDNSFASPGRSTPATALTPSIVNSTHQRQQSSVFTNFRDNASIRPEDSVSAGTTLADLCFSRIQAEIYICTQ